MPEIQEVSWHRASGATGKHDEPGVSFISSIYGYWKGYSCMITPMHQHDRLYHITLGGLPSKNVTPVHNSHLGPREAVDWALGTMERLQEGEEERAERAQAAREKGERKADDAIQHLSELVGIPQGASHT